MIEWVHLIGGAMYAACVDFMLNLAWLSGTTYRDANALVLLVGFPLTTFLLLIAVLIQAWVIRRRSRAARALPRT